MKRIVSAVFAAGLIACVRIQNNKKSNPADLPKRVGYPVQVATFSARPIYRYSVIPGGVRSTTELDAREQADPVVRRYYKHFNEPRGAVLTLKKTEFVYVSYRIGNQIWWTSHRLKIRAGEKVLSDGQIEIRARCGNQLSVVKRWPVRMQEPTDRILNETIEPRPVSIAEELIPPEIVGVTFRADAPGLIPVSPVVGDFHPLKSPAGVFNPLRWSDALFPGLSPLLFCSHNCDGIPTKSPLVSGIPENSVPITENPEPNTLTLLGVIVVAVAALPQFRKKIFGRDQGRHLPGVAFPGTRFAGPESAHPLARTKAH